MEDVESPYHVRIFGEEDASVSADEVRAMVEKAEYSRARFEEVSERPIEELVEEYQTGELGDWAVPFVVMDTKKLMDEAADLGGQKRLEIEWFLRDGVELRILDTSPSLEVQAGPDHAVHIPPYWSRRARNRSAWTGPRVPSPHRSSDQAGREAREVRMDEV